VAIKILKKDKDSMKDIEKEVDFWTPFDSLKTVSLAFIVSPPTQYIV